MNHLPALTIKNVHVLTPYLLALVLVMQVVTTYMAVDAKSYAENSDYICSATNDMVKDLSDEVSSLRRKVELLEL